MRRKIICRTEPVIAFEEDYMPRLRRDAMGEFCHGDTEAQRKTKTEKGIRFQSPGFVPQGHY
jgi:hypothetical protein